MTQYAVDSLYAKNESDTTQMCLSGIPNDTGKYHDFGNHLISGLRMGWGHIAFLRLSIQNIEIREDSCLFKFQGVSDPFLFHCFLWLNGHLAA